MQGIEIYALKFMAADGHEHEVISIVASTELGGRMGVAFPASVTGLSQIFFGP